MPWPEQWHSVGEFVAMGGHAVFVWGSLGACALGMLLEVLGLAARHRAALREAERWKEAT